MPYSGIRENSGTPPTPNSHEFGYTGDGVLW
jgi:hypothetical protein